METTKGSLVGSYLLQILDRVESGTGLVHTPTDVFFSTGILKLLSKNYTVFSFFPKSHFYQLVGRIFISTYPSRMSKWSTNHLVAWNDSLWMILGSKSLDKMRQGLDKIWRSFEEFEPI